jgi:hypothetical protein
MKTIGRHWRGPRGDYPVKCDYCGVLWRRSQCILDAEGKIQCPDDRGLTRSELDKLNTEGSQSLTVDYGPRDGSNPYTGGN